MLSLRRGDDATLDFSALASASGATLPNFAVDDVLAFTLRQAYDSAPAMVAVTSASGRVTWTPASSTGAVAIHSADWAVSELGHELLDCVWDLQRTTAANVVTTVAAGTLAVLPDVTHA